MLSLHRVVFEEEPGDPGVYGAVADYEDVQERLPEAAPVLHLPAGRVVLPHVQRVVDGLAGLVNVDLLLLVVPVLPAEELGPRDQLPPALVVHEGTELSLDHFLHLQTIFICSQPTYQKLSYSLGPSLSEGLNQLATLLEVSQLVERTVIFTRGPSDNSEGET